MNRAVYPAVFRARRSSEHRRSICGNYAQYEERKAAWRAINQDATQADHDRAMQRIARECGV
jgi:hypothetical protein